MPERDLGKLVSVHGIAKLYTKRIFVITAICLAAFAFGTYSVVNELSRGSRDHFGNAVGFVVCGIVPFAMICISLWTWFRKRKADLRLYENGFTYLLAGKMQTCYWNEITNVFFEERAVFTPKNKTFVCSVQTRGEENIIFIEAIEDIEKIYKFIEEKLSENGGAEN